MNSDWVITPPSAEEPPKPEPQPLSDSGGWTVTPPAAPPADQSWRGSIMPFSRDAAGNFNYLDPTAGVIGALKAPFDWAYNVRTGKIPADVRNPEYIGGAVDAALTYGPSMFGVRHRATPKTPSAKALKEAGETGFQAYRDLNQVHDVTDYRGFLVGTQQRLRQLGLNDEDTHKILQDQLDRYRKGGIVLSRDLDELRLALGGGKNPAKMEARSALFDYMEKSAAPENQSLVRDAVGNYRQAMHSKTVTDAMAKTSGKNIAKAQGENLTAEQTRTNIANLLASDRKMRGFSDIEKALLTDARNASWDINLAQRIGNTDLRPPIYAAGGTTLGALTSAATLGGGLPTKAAAAAAGLGAATVPVVLGARSYANRGARQLYERAENAIRAQSPLFQQAPQYNAGIAKRDAITGAILGGIARQQPKEIPQTYRVRPDGTVEEFL